MEKHTTFRIGIAMAGAISAGAYTAGVMDYLLEALENWQKAKDLGLPGVPQHEILIEVLSGASAGGMTAVITSASLRKDFPHIDQHNYSQEICRDNPLYDSWVNMTESHKSDMMSQMLDPDDLAEPPGQNPEEEVRSIFNSRFIGNIAHRNLGSVILDPGKNRPFFACDMELLTTLTNLRGYQYQLEFIAATGKREDRMTMHRDFLHFQHNPSGVYRGDGKIPFHFDTPDGLNKDLLVDAALATGAFPAGLAPRLVTRDPRYVNDNPLLKITHGKQFIVDPLSDYSAVCVDGGVINNEPYDLTQTILANRREKRYGPSAGNGSATIPELPKSASTFDTTILMIDPFPNYDDHPDANHFNSMGLKITSLQLLLAMRRQLMVKTDLLSQAYDEDDFTRFMIAPVRTRDAVTQKYAIACGSAGGFGGFFSKKFRIHDFMLGRRNCQRFIQHFFCVPASAGNPIIEYGYSSLTPDETAFLTLSDSRSLPVIPDIRVNKENTSITRALTEEEFQYPAIRIKYLADLEKKVRTRLGYVLNNLSYGHQVRTKQENPAVRRLRRKSWLKRYILNPFGSYAADRFISIGKHAAKNLAARKFIDLVITDMDQRGLLQQ